MVSTQTQWADLYPNNGQPLTIAHTLLPLNQGRTWGLPRGDNHHFLGETTTITGSSIVAAAPLLTSKVVSGLCAAPTSHRLASTSAQWKVAKDHSQTRGITCTHGLHQRRTSRCVGPHIPRVAQQKPRCQAAVCHRAPTPCTRIPVSQTQYLPLLGF